MGLQSFFTFSVLWLLPSLPMSGDSEIKVIKDLEFATVGSHSYSLKMDLYLPIKPEGSALVVWIHGGGWRKGSKEKCQINWLPKYGYSLASISYRLSNLDKFPAQLHDCKGAVRWLRADAKKFGYDPNKIVVAGTSAGGHLSALMATSYGVSGLEGKTGGNLAYSSKVLGAVDYYGATDLILRSKNQPSRTNLVGSVVYDLLGGGADEKPELAKLASSAHHISKDDAPMLVFHGTEDSTVFLDQSKALVQAYQKAGLSIQFIEVAGAGHGGKTFFEGQNRLSLLHFLKQLTSRGSEPGKLP